MTKDSQWDTQEFKGYSNVKKALKTPRLNVFVFVFGEWVKITKTQAELLVRKTRLAIKAHLYTHNKNRHILPCLYLRKG